MPSAPGDYRYSVEYRQGWSRKTETGTFHVRNGRRRGPIRIDPENRWHFIWEGTGEHYFFNGTTAYWLMGWTDERIIESSLERLHRLKINRVRVTVAGRTSIYYGEPVMSGRAWTPLVTPWATDKEGAFSTPRTCGPALRIGPWPGVFDSLSDLGLAEDIYHPGFDYSRFRARLLAEVRTGVALRP